MYTMIGCLDNIVCGQEDNENGSTTVDNIRNNKDIRGTVYNLF